MTSSNSQDIEEQVNQGNSLSLKEAKKAYRLVNQAWYKNDADLSRQAHDKLRSLVSGSSSVDLPAVSSNGGARRYVKSIVFGGLDGIVTTFSVVAAVAGGGLAAGVVVIMGISNLLGDGLSMGLGDYLSSKAQLDYINQQYAKEKWETENYLQGEIEEMVAIYMQHGMSERDARDMLSIMCKYRNVFVRTMMMEELDLLPPSENETPWKEGCAMFLSFCIFGALPLIAYAVVPFNNSTPRLILACIVTVIGLAILGAAKGKMTGQTIWRTSLMMCVNGACAATVAYSIAWGINKAAGISENCSG